MKFTVSDKAGETQISLSGNLTFDDHEIFKGVVNLVESSQSGIVVIDLSRVQMIDSAGIGMLLLANDRARAAAKTLRIGGAAGSVQKVIEVSRLHDLIPAA